MNRKVEIIILWGSIVLLIFLRIHVAIVRFIDPDEFAHLHWAYLLVSGKIPYKDFFLYHIPLYQLYLTPIFWLPQSSFLIYLARIWEFVLYISVIILLGKITLWFTKNTRLFLLAIFLFLTFPMTFDKTVDIRPDMLMIFFYLLSIYISLVSPALTFKKLLLVGFFFGLSLMTFPKIIFALPSLVYLLILKLKLTPGVRFGLIGRLTSAWPVVIGTTIPFLIYSLLLAVTGSFEKGIELVTQGAWAVSAGKIPFSPWLALSPWPVIYVGNGGPSLPWFFNTTLWILATFGFLILAKINKHATIFLGIFFGGGIIFLFAFPAPYIQYFVPLSVFASVLAAVFIHFAITFLDALVKTRLKPSLIFLLLTIVIGLSSFYLQYGERAEATSEEQTGVIDTIAAVVRPEETMYDMVGSYLYRPDGYYICCHPYAEFVDKLKTKPPPLPQSLIANKTKFIVLDRTGLAFWKPLPEDLQFLFKHYIESPHKKIYVLGAKFLCRNGSCDQVDINNRPIVTRTSTFDIIIPESYVIETYPANAPVVINGSQISPAPLAFSPGLYTFYVPPTVSMFQLRLAR